MTASCFPLREGARWVYAVTDPMGSRFLTVTMEPPVEIDVTQGPCRGRTVVDQLRRTGQAANAHVSNDVDAAAFIDLLTGRIGTLP